MCSMRNGTADSVSERCELKRKIFFVKYSATKRMIKVEVIEVINSTTILLLNGVGRFLITGSM